MCEAAELAGVRDFWAAAPTAVRREAGIVSVEIASATCVAVGAVPDVVLLNRVLGLGVGAPVTDDDLDSIDSFFAGMETRYGIALAPETDPGLAERLAARGFEPGYAWMKFERGSGPPPDARTELRVERVGPGDDFGLVFARGYGVPDFVAPWSAELVGRSGWHCFAAFDGDVPVGCGVLYVADGAGWLSFGATLAEHRGKGAQSALLAARIRASVELGCDRLVTETGERVPDRASGSYRNILRAGFTEAYLRPNYLSPVRS